MISSRHMQAARMPKSLPLASVDSCKQQHKYGRVSVISANFTCQDGTPLEPEQLCDGVDDCPKWYLFYAIDEEPKRCAGDGEYTQTWHITSPSCFCFLSFESGSGM